MPLDKAPHQMISDELTVEIVMELQNRSTINLEGVDVEIGLHPDHGNITIIRPAAGLSCLIYPFDIQDQN